MADEPLGTDTVAGNETIEIPEVPEALPKGRFRGHPVRAGLAGGEVPEHDRRDAPEGAREAQGGQHPRMIGPGIMADTKQRVAVIEILQGHRPFADTD